MNLVALLVLLGVLITVHELGHFIVAKLSGVRVLTFSLGFGPKLVGFTRGDTEYRLSMLPLGGYVRMYGDDITAEVPAHERQFAFLEKPFLAKSAIAIAGPAANLLLPVALFFSLNVGEERVNDAVVGTVLTGEAADAAGVQPGDRITAVEGQPVATFADIATIVSARAGQPTRLALTRTVDGKPVQIEVVATPSAQPSPDPTQDAPVGRLGLLATRALPVIVVARGSAADRAGLRSGDRVLSVDGVAVADRTALERALRAAPPTAPITLVVERTADAAAGASGQAAPATTRHTIVLPAGPAPAEPPSAPEIEATRFAVLNEEIEAPALAERIAATRALVVAAVEAQRAARGIGPWEGLVADVAADTPAAQKGIKAREHRVVAVDGRPLRVALDLASALQAEPEGIHVIGLVDGDGDGTTCVFRMQKSTRRELGGARVLGVALASAQGEGAMITRQIGPGAAFIGALKDTMATARGVLGGYAMLLTGKVGLEQLGGPVLIANIAGEAARSGVEVFVATMCLISVNLAFLNLLPVPVLDGGHLLLFTVEAVRRKRLSVEARLKATRVGLFFVGALMLVALFNDVVSLFS